MASLGKKFGQLRQWTGEKMGSSQKTETSEEFKRLEQETDLRREFTEKVHEALAVYLKSMGKRKESLTDKTKKLPLEIMADAMIHFGTMLHEDSNYGRALIKFGECHERIANIQLEYVTRVRDSYVNNISRILADMKEYTQLKAKLERRRLDFDAKLNKVQKSRKEKPELEEETRAAQSKYEESLTDTTHKMIELNSNEEDQLEDLLNFMDAEVTYHKKCLDIISGLQQTLADIPRNPNSHAGAARMSVTARSSVNDPPQRRPSGDSFGPPSTARPTGPDRKLSYAANAGSMVYPMVGPNGSTVPAPIPQRQDSSSSLPLASVPQPSTSPAKKQVRVLFDFDAEGPDELTLRKGDIINVVCEIDEGWWEGELSDGSGTVGMFPSNYVEVLTNNLPSMPPRNELAGGSDPAYQPRSSEVEQTPRPNSDINLSPTSVSQQRPQDRPYSHISRLSFVPTNAPIPPQQQVTQASPAALEGLVQRSSAAGGAPFPPPASPASRGRMSFVGGQLPVSNHATTATPCGTCGCAEFLANAFRKDQCSNCYHRH
ncbi:uncharacterized protein SPPG_07783 [Spizellomyces punctatus DAOM BR117]|uniref:BAR domain-containing protein n=1 Tax=Spizellomyces punctatus (strain DAOM BR117) TaxID=645134 RepID=A0A0L0H6U6_SPIPD|nr:uncharacterized protein SPPG_07783 [Spizellomyces punctatus DAOM BR117]KNC96962.1 hypothetical protein SPPG_07783 [Spizellomyces punctatus DAOM BR117]|eukprot:XP_016605002.1 hypothetical protein SPPG_07783 [Spizellomyces punctatus DAOM BR117]